MGKLNVRDLNNLEESEKKVALVTSKLLALIRKEELTINEYRKVMARASKIIYQKTVI